MNTTGHPLVSFDPKGVCFAIALGSRFIRLYDLRKYQQGPFATFEVIEKERAAQPHSYGALLAADCDRGLVADRVE